MAATDTRLTETRQQQREWAVQEAVGERHYRQCSTAAGLMAAVDERPVNYVMVGMADVVLW